MGVIGGIINTDASRDSRAELNRLLFSQSHRDPAQSAAIFAGEGCAFGMLNSHDNRWLDPNATAHGATPGYWNGAYAFVDGIILDGRRVAAELRAMRIEIRRESCAQIVACAYAAWGLDFMRHLEGEFACAIWDANTKKLILARDPVGHKPLHYYAHGGRTVFSSEIKGILAAGVTAEIDELSLSDFLSLNCVPSPNTIYKNIIQVRAGHVAVIAGHALEKSQEYFSAIAPPDSAITEADAKEQVSGLIREAVRKRMVSTPETYCFLSGGMDSSAVLSFAAELSPKPVHAISVGFEESTHNEIADAKAMADHAGAIHHPLICKPESFFDMLDTLIFHHDQPFTDTSCYPTYFAGKLARTMTDIIITGDGPDQIIGGSGHHVFALKNNLFDDPAMAKRVALRTVSGMLGILAPSPSPSFLSKTRRRIYRDSLTSVRHMYELRSVFPELVKKYLCSPLIWKQHATKNPYRLPEQWFAEAEGRDNISKYLHADIRFYVPDDLMVKVDRMCMAHGLETVSPYQDVALGRKLISLPGSLKVKRTDDGEYLTKYILRKIGEDRFPESLKSKKKKGFSIPIEAWLRQDGGRRLREILLDERTLARPYFRRKPYEQLVNAFIDGKQDYFFGGPMAIVALLTFELWNRRYIDRPFSPERA